MSLLPGGSCDIQLIEEICNKSSRDNPHLSYNFCAEAIEAVPESCHADLNGLGIISSKLALLNATHIQHLILELKNQTSDSNTSQALDQCLEVYSDAISDLEESINAFTFGSYDDANVFVSAAMTNSGDCEGGFQDKQGGKEAEKSLNLTLFQLFKTIHIIVPFIVNIDPWISRQVNLPYLALV
ncbi:hypothetical protein ACLOJK_033785 [Asimina triloba]